MAKTITADEYLVASLDLNSVTDREGNPAQVQGDPTWATSDPTVITVEPQGDGTCRILSHMAGTARLMVEADADLGDGIIPINGSEDITVTAGRAATLTINLGDAAPKEDIAAAGAGPAPTGAADGAAGGAEQPTGTEATTTGGTQGQP